MEKKDLATISIAVAFNKKWWDKHRSSKIKGTGTGALLDQWRKTNLAGTLSLEGLKSAYKDCDELKKSLQEAKKLCGPKEADDEKGIDKMLDLLADHRKELDKRKKTIDDMGELLQGLTEQIGNLKPEVNRCAKEFAALQVRFQNAERAAGMDISNEDKQQLLKNVVRLNKDMEDLRLDLVERTNGMRTLLGDKDTKQKLKSAKDDKGFKSAFQTFESAVAGFDEIANRLHENLQMLQTNSLELEKDIAGTATVDATVKLLDTQLVMLTHSPIFQGWYDILDKARVWLPKIITARKDTKKLTPTEWKDFADLVPELEEGGKQAENAAGQIARILKMVQKNAARFPDHPEVKRLYGEIQAAAKVRMGERTQFQKTYPPLLTSLKQLVDMQA